MIDAKHQCGDEECGTPIDVGCNVQKGSVLLRVFGVVLEMPPHEAERMAASLLEQARAVRS